MSGKIGNETIILKFQIHVHHLSNLSKTNPEPSEIYGKPQAEAEDKAERLERGSLHHRRKLLQQQEERGCPTQPSRLNETHPGYGISVLSLRRRAIWD